MEVAVIWVPGWVVVADGMWIQEKRQAVCWEATTFKYEPPGFKKSCSWVGPLYRKIGEARGM